MPTSRGAHCRPATALMALVLVGSFVRVWGIRPYYYNPDEMQFVIIAKANALAEVWRRALAELHPPLSHFIRHYLLMISDDVFVQRLFSVVPGIFSILGLYRFGRILRGPGLGLFLAACMALSPVAVSTSTTVRNYALFMAFTSWGLGSFARYRQLHASRDLVTFALLLLLASATHFSGFLVAAVCGIHEGTRLLLEGRWRSLLSFGAALLPLLCLGLLLHVQYLAHGTAGPMWTDLMVTSGFMPGDFTGRWRTLGAGIAGEFIPFVTFFGRTSIGLEVLLLVSGLVLFGLHVAGLRRMWGADRPAALLVLTAWGVAVAAALANVYPFAPTRHNYCWFPFLLLPLGYLLEPFAERIDRRALVLLVPITAGLVASGVYLRYGDEFALEQRDFADGQRYLLDHLAPGDDIVTGRIAAYFYLLYAKDGGATPYDRYEAASYFNETRVLAPFDPPFRPHGDWRPFRDDLASQVAGETGRPGARVWFVMYAWKSTEIWHLMECPAARPLIRDFMSRDGVVIFSIRREDLLEFVRRTDAWDGCYADYRPLISAQAFSARTDGSAAGDTRRE